MKRTALGLMIGLAPGVVTADQYTCPWADTVVRITIEDGEAVVIDAAKSIHKEDPTPVSRSPKSGAFSETSFYIVEDGFFFSFELRHSSTGTELINERTRFRDGRTWYQDGWCFEEE